MISWIHFFWHTSVSKFVQIMELSLSQTQLQEQTKCMEDREKVNDCMRECSFCLPPSLPRQPRRRWHPCWWMTANLTFILASVCTNSRSVLWQTWVNTSNWAAAGWSSAVFKVIIASKLLRSPWAFGVTINRRMWCGLFSNSRSRCYCPRVQILAWVIWLRLRLLSCCQSLPAPQTALVGRQPHHSTWLEFSHNE